MSKPKEVYSNLYEATDFIRSIHLEDGILKFFILGFFASSKIGRQDAEALLSQKITWGEYINKVAKHLELETEQESFKQDFDLPKDGRIEKAKQFLNIFLRQLSEEENLDLAQTMFEMWENDLGRKENSIHSSKQINALLEALIDKDVSGTYYDPCFGINSFLNSKVLNADVIYGHEVMQQTSIFSKLFLKGINPRADVKLKNINSLLHADQDMEFEKGFANLVITAPPINQRVDSRVKDYLGRFSHGIFTTDTSLNYVEHVIYSLNNSGKGFVILSQGSLSRGGQAQKIRQNLIESGKVEAVVLLPGNLLSTTAIPLCILVVSNTDSLIDSVKMINASNLSPVKKSKRILEYDFSGIISDYKANEQFSDFTKLVSLEQISRNNFNLNPNLYIYEEFTPPFRKNLDEIERDLERSIQEHDALKLGFLKHGRF